MPEFFDYQHYHSLSHEVLGIYSGRITLQSRGEQGSKIEIEEGDVLVIPTGVKQKNLGNENDVSIVGAYPGGRDYEMNYVKSEERPATDINISKVPFPLKYPVTGKGIDLTKIWNFN